jgi:hypothetical protein
MLGVLLCYLGQVVATKIQGTGFSLDFSGFSSCKYIGYSC